MTQLFKRFNIFFEPLDAQGRVLPRDPSFWEYLCRPFPPEPLALVDVFPELSGMEEEIDRIVTTGKGEFRLPAVIRGNRYFSLNVFPELVDDLSGLGARGIVALEDETDAMAIRQALVQDRNEITLLTRKLETRNTELSDANQRLDVLMNLIRTQNHDLELKVKIRTKELHDSRLSVITTLARVAEFRDTDTGGHIYRIGRSCVLIGKKQGLSAAECETLFYSSLLHDVGKIGIPDSVLLKSASLNTEEWKVMRDHTRIGAELLHRDDHLLFNSAREVALYHHERWDGTGYPEKISGENIPLMSRICAVADVFDALMSVRPYKKAWTEDQALDAIVKGSGSAFDPSVVKSFLDVLDDILSLRRESEELELLLPEFD